MTTHELTGRALDAEIAEKVMGFQTVNEWNGTVGRHLVSPNGCLAGWWIKDDQFMGHLDGVVHHATLPNYSTEIAAAWLVVERWREKGDGFQLDSLGFSGEAWRCGFMDASNDGMEIYWGEAPTAPLAICRAALAACGG